METKIDDRPRRLIQKVKMAAVGTIAVYWAAALDEYCVVAIGPDGRQVAEYFTDIKSDALGTADLMLAELAELAGMPP